MARTLTTFFLLLLLTACGFRPLYGPESADGAIANVEIAQIPDRIGQVMENELSYLMPVRGEPRFRLAVDIDTRRDSLGIRADGAATRERQQVTITAHLTRLGEKQPLETFTMTNALGYDVVQSDFSNELQRERVEQQQIRALARRLYQQLVRYFSDMR